MDLCRDVQVDDVKPAQVGDEEFLFQVNDPCRMHDKYRRGMDDAPILRNTYRKPDILGTMFAAVRAVTKHPNTRGQCKTRDEYIEHGHEQKRPQKFLSWADARIAAEFKYKVPTNKTKVTPQGDWSRKAAPTPRGSARELIQDNPEVQGSTARTLPSFGMVVTSGAASGHVGSGGSKRKHSEAAGGAASASNKRAKREEVEGDGDPEDPEDPDGFVDEDDGKAKVRGVLNGAVQLAIYASARLSSSSMICHSLNLLVDGETAAHILTRALTQRLQEGLCGSGTSIKAVSPARRAWTSLTTFRSSSCFWLSSNEWTVTRSGSTPLSLVFRNWHRRKRRVVCAQMSRLPTPLRPFNNFVVRARGLLLRRNPAEGSSSSALSLAAFPNCLSSSVVALQSST
jgi:hypothetical protein